MFHRRNIPRFNNDFALKNITGDISNKNKVAENAKGHVLAAFTGG